MEGLYRLKKHVIGYDKEKAITTFIKDLEIETFYFENELDSTFEIEFNKIKYSNKDCEVEKVNYDPKGNFLQIEYITKDRQIKFKEIYRYIFGAILERYFILKPRFNGKLNFVNIISPKLKYEEAADVDLLVPLDNKFRYKNINSNLKFEKAPESSSGIFIFNDKRSNANVICWYYNSISSTPKYNDNKVSFLIEIKKELKVKEELIIGAQYFKFYEENYVESLELLEKFYRRESLNIKNLESKKIDIKNLSGPLNYKNNKAIYNKLFSELLYSYYKGEISSLDLKEWLKLEKTIMPRKMAKVYYGYKSKSSKFIDKKSKKLFSVLCLLLGNAYLEKKDEESIKEINEITKKNSILKNGRLYFDNIKTDKNTLSFIKSYENSFYIIILNFSYLKREVEIKLKEKFIKDNLKLDRYIVKNLMSEEIELLITDFNKFKIDINGSDFKILKLENFEAIKYIGIKEEVYNDNEIFMYENNFYNIIFSKQNKFFSGFNTNNTNNNIISDIEISFDSKMKNYEIKKIKNNLLINTENTKLKFVLNKSNLINFELEYTGNQKKGKISFKFSNVIHYLVKNKIYNIENKFNDLEKINLIGEKILSLQNIKNNFKEINYKISNDKLEINFKLKDIKKHNVSFDLLVL